MDKGRFLRDATELVFESLTQGLKRALDRADHAMLQRLLGDTLIEKHLEELTPAYPGAAPSRWRAAYEGWDPALQWTVEVVALLGWLDVQWGTGESESLDSRRARLVQSGTRLLKFLPPNSARMMQVYAECLRQAEDEREWDLWLLENREFVAQTVDFGPHLDIAVAVGLSRCEEVEQPSAETMAFVVAQGGIDRLARALGRVDTQAGWWEGARTGRAPMDWPRWLNELGDAARGRELENERLSELKPETAWVHQQSVAESIRQNSVAFQVADALGRLVPDQRRENVLNPSIYTGVLVPKMFLTRADWEATAQHRGEEFGRTIARTIDEKLLEALDAKSAPGIEVGPGEGWRTLEATLSSSKLDGQPILIVADPFGLGALMWHRPEFVKTTALSTEWRRQAACVGGWVHSGSVAPIFHCYRRKSQGTYVLSVSDIKSSRVAWWPSQHSGAAGPGSEMAWCHAIDLNIDFEEQSRHLAANAIPAGDEPGEAPIEALRRHAVLRAFGFVSIELSESAAPVRIRGKGASPWQ